MTLLIALIANAIHAHLVGTQYISGISIIAIWLLHLVFVNARRGE